MGYLLPNNDESKSPKGLAGAELEVVETGGSNKFTRPSKFS